MEGKAKAAEALSQAQVVLQMDSRKSAQKQKEVSPQCARRVNIYFQNRQRMAQKITLWAISPANMKALNKILAIECTNIRKSNVTLHQTKIKPYLFR